MLAAVDRRDNEFTLLWLRRQLPPAFRRFGGSVFGCSCLLLRVVLPDAPTASSSSSSHIVPLPRTCVILAACVAVVLLGAFA